jgi:hypothetical protein
MIRRDDRRLCRGANAGPAQLDAHGYLLVVTCACLRPSSYEEGCVCEHSVERRVYRVDADGRERYATRPLGETP